MQDSSSAESTRKAFPNKSAALQICVMDALAPEELEREYPILHSLQLSLLIRETDWKQDVMKRRTGRVALIKFVNNTAFPLYRYAFLTIWAQMLSNICPKESGLLIS